VRFSPALVIAPSKYGTMPENNRPPLLKLVTKSHNYVLYSCNDALHIMMYPNSVQSFGLSHTTHTHAHAHAHTHTHTHTHTACRSR